MKSEIYNALTSPEAEWICTNCGMPNFSTSLFESFLDPNESLHDASVNTTSSDPGSPMCASSPQPTQAKHKLNSIRFLQANIQSINAKKEVLWELLDSTEPDIFAGCETWLNKNIGTSEILPPGFVGYRKDRPDGYGGVMIAVSNKLISEQIHIDTQDEVLAVKIQTNTASPLIIISAYRPPNKDLAATESICNTIKDIALKSRNSPLWVAGDFNLPDIDWTTGSITGHQNPVGVNESFMNLAYDLGLEQTVDFNTRGNNILDLFLSNRPSLIQRSELLPGISDHECILTISDIKARFQRPLKREIHLWDKGNLDQMKIDVKQFASSFVETHTTNTPIEDLWKTLKTAIHETVQTNIPQKMTTSRYSQPWITSNTKKFAKKKKRLLKRACKNPSPKNWEKY
jgi:hypothetical protein